MKKFVVMAFFFLLFTACVGSSPEISISVDQIPKVLGRDHLPKLPDWKIESVVSYNDSFTNPSVTIMYHNGVAISLARSNWDLSQEYVSHKQVTIGNKTVEYYDNDGGLAYVFHLEGVYYAIRSPKLLQDETEAVIETL